MRRHSKKIARDYIGLLGQAHEAVKKALESKKTETALDLLGQCQEAAIQLGNLIEEEEGEGFVTVGLLEDYCELVFQVYTLVSQEQTLNPNKSYKQLRAQIIKVQNSIHRDTKERLEVVFLPYKASMWDSLESVWMAAEQDENCDAYVIPIPYFDKNPDGTVKEMHYEADEFPKYVTVTGYEEYDFQERHPDMVFIHNPYDDHNYVTSVHPYFYSYHIKQYTDLLVYIPYFSTAGGMSEGQMQCPAYYSADYIIMQAEKYRKFYDPELPKGKLLPLGSPKFDRVMRLCQNPPEAPEEWKEKMRGKKVYFYNTSINGMLGNTKYFLKKMEYVFRCFEGREDACLLWRPHPLLESTFESLRKEYKPVYDTLKRYFLTKNIGIYDETPDITDTIALSDAYIGDAATSVTSLFGLAGKPLFILNNEIYNAPEEEDYRGQIIRGFPQFDLEGKETFYLTQGNKLYRSEGREHQYHYFCDLSEYAYGNYYGAIASINGKKYVCPICAQDILVLGEDGVERKIVLRQEVEQAGAFYTAAMAEEFLFLIPNWYPAIVRYDAKKDEIVYYRDHLDVFIGMGADGERRVGGVRMQKDKLYLASPVDNRVLVMDIRSKEQQVVTISGTNKGGWMGITGLPNEDELWMLPFEGYVITRWNPVTGEVTEYSNIPEGFGCIHPIHGYACMERPFNGTAFDGDKVYLSPGWGNMYLCIDRKSEEITEWKPPVEMPTEPKNGYFMAWAHGALGYLVDEHLDWKANVLFSYYDRKSYYVDFKENICTEIEVTFDKEELQAHEPGFCEDSQWLQYACSENAFYSLEDFLDGKEIGAPFDKERQMRAFGEIAANHDGTCGEKIYEFMRKELGKR